LNEAFTPLASPFSFWDPALFQDEDGKVFLYWGRGNQELIWGIELNANTLMPIGEKIALFGEQDQLHGWERSGENNRLKEPETEIEKKMREYLGTKPFFEGAFMNKHNGKYYLQYSAPETEYNVYSDGVYIGEPPWDHSLISPTTHFRQSRVAL